MEWIGYKRNANVFKCNCVGLTVMLSKMPVAFRDQPAIAAPDRRRDQSGSRTKFLRNGANVASSAPAAAT
jgi:hypothetical protein